MNSLEDNHSKRYSIGDKSLIIEDSEDVGLERIVVDRDSFFRSDKIVKYVKNAQSLKIYGSVISFFLANESLVDAVKEVANSGGKVELLMTNPNSQLTNHFKKEDQWHGKLNEILDTSLEKLMEIKATNKENIRLYLFDGVVHNTIISTEKNIIVSPYIFGKRGWYAPTLIFNKDNSTVVSAFDEQLDEMKKYGEDNPGTFIEIENEEDFMNA